VRRSGSAPASRASRSWASGGKPARAIREAAALVRRLLAGETVDLRGEVVRFHGGRLDVAPARPGVPIYVASNGPLGQRAAGAVADGAIMEGCANPEEARALAAAVRAGAVEAGETPAVELVARLNTCIATTALRRDVPVPVARTLGAGGSPATLESQGWPCRRRARASRACRTAPASSPTGRSSRSSPTGTSTRWRWPTAERSRARRRARPRGHRLCRDPPAAPGRNGRHHHPALRQEVLPRAQKALAHR
jgi:alkanesulfonate monooxygenase SsuD/methylene tetrahydromethanopterin reductase-like flavin-dependent oxidoreductase (luciferase family)